MTQPKSIRLVTEGLIEDPTSTVRGLLNNTYEPLGAAAAAAAASEPLTVSGKRAVRRGEQEISVKEYGAVGDGTTDDTAAIDAARAASATLYFPAGTYLYTGSGLSGADLNIRGAGRNVTTIKLGAGKSFVVGTTSTRLRIADLRFINGFGAVRFTGTGNAVGSVPVIERCEFKDYTGAAISHMSVDWPYWHIRDCIFDGANDTTTIGIALNGDPAGTSIDACEFLRNRVHIKFGGNNGAGGAYIVRCDFIRFQGYSTTPRTDVWVTPASSITSGPGFLLDSCKFGPENINTNDYRILYADADGASGSTNADQWPSFASSSGYITGHRVRDCLVSGVAGHSPSFVYSTTPNVRAPHIGPVVVSGTKPEYLLKFLTPPGDDPQTTQAVIGPVVSNDVAVNDDLPLTNALGFGEIIDPTNQLTPSTHKLSNMGGANPSGYVNVLNAGAWNIVTGATVTATTDALGGTDAADIAYPTNGAYVFRNLNMSNLVAGVGTWLEFDIAAPSTGSPLPMLNVNISGDTGAGVITKRVSVPGGTTWRPIRIYFTPRSTSLQLRIRLKPASGGSGNFRVGRLRAYQAREPLPATPAAVGVPITTVAPSAGAAAALPATPAGYLDFYINGALRKIPYY